MVSFGGMANISAISSGIFIQTGPLGEGFRTKYGLGGIQETDATGKTIILGKPVKEKEARSRWNYGNNVPPFASIGVDIGIVKGIGVRVDFLELLDLVLGFGNIDIMQDDKIEEVLIKKNN